MLLALHLKKAQVALPQLLAPMVLKLAGLLVLVQVPHRCYWNLSNQTQKILIMTNCVLSVAGCNAELQHSFRCVYLGCGFGAAQTGRSMCASMEMHMHTRTPSPKHTHTPPHTRTIRSHAAAQAAEATAQLPLVTPIATFTTTTTTTTTTAAAAAAAGAGAGAASFWNRSRCSCSSIYRRCCWCLLLGGLQNTFNGNVLCSVRAPLFQAKQGSMRM